jgi:dTDP-4-dehydrorhamnose reductase
MDTIAADRGGISDLTGLYHYSNEGVASWYDFAYEIFRIAGLEARLIPVRSEEYPTPATRPAFSVLDKEKIKRTFGLTIPHWKTSLENCMKNLGEGL